MFEPSPTTGIYAALSGALAVACLLASRRTLLGTTLMASCGWSIASVALVAACELAIGFAGQHAGVGPLRFAAAVATLCPAISVLGARRPHNGAWQFIVLSLWLVLALPAAEVFLLQRGQALEIHEARSWFLLGLIFVGFFNALPTRRWLTALLWGCGQTSLLTEYLPYAHHSLGAAGVLAGLLLLCCSTIAGCRGLPNRSQEPSWNRLWLDFRDLFGALWSLRVLERINTDAGAEQRGMFLRWRGFHTANGDAVDHALSTDEFQATRQNMRNLLRRFVSPEWIAARIGAEETAAAKPRDDG